FSATLLVTNVDDLDPQSWGSIDDLIDAGVGPQLLGFALSFTVIALFWRANVRVSRALVGMDGPTTAANLVAVALVILVPFTTRGISAPTDDPLALPTALYATNLALAACAQSAIWIIAHARGLQRVRLPRRGYAAALLDAAVVPVVFAASIPITFAAGPEAGQWTWASLIVLIPLARRFAARMASDPGR